MYMTDGVTEEANTSQLLDFGLSTKAYKLGNLFIIKAEVLMREACFISCRSHTFKKNF